MSRMQTMQQWVAQVLGYENLEVVPLAGDASFRRYFRVFSAQPKASWVLVDAPPPESLEPFISLALAYRQAGVHVPAVIAAQYDAGLMLLEDFGDQLLHGVLTSESAPRMYARALAELPAIMRVTEHRQGQIPPYDRALLMRENSLFHDWLLGSHLQLTLSPAEQKLWEQFSARMIAQALAQPTVGVHRDYHSRNLMLTPEQTVGIIDFQDAVTGPVTYDVVSLLRDCYVRWPKEVVLKLAQQCRELLQDRGLLDKQIGADQWQEWFDWMGLQRHTKASGIFARLSIRDGKQGYLDDIPNTVQYLADVAADHAELRDYHEWITTRIQPAIAERSALIGAN